MEAGAMLRPIGSLGILLLASGLLLAPLAFPGMPTWRQIAVAADEASEALKKCDALASHPHDPGRYAPGVTDEQFAPGAAIEACEPAARLNPDVARAWFELGRSYWIGQRDSEAFAAFVEAAKRSYAPAMKYLGDAYLEGRGLPPGQSQNVLTALEWYKKSADGRFADGVNAVEEVQTYIKKKTDEAEQARLEAEKAKFDASIFQNPQIMSRIYEGTLNGVNKSEFAYYINGFIHTIGGTEPFFVNGQSCIPLVAGTTTSGVTKLVIEVTQNNVTTPAGPNYFTDVFRDRNPFVYNMIKFQDQGHRDAIALFNRYGCDGAVAHTVVENINIYFDPSRRTRNSADEAKQSVREYRTQPGISYVERRDRSFSSEKPEDCAADCMKDPQCGRATFWSGANRCFMFTKGARTEAWGFKDKKAISFSFE